ncbi:MAG: phosphatidate cytidylyltransferase [Desulfuromonadaceae bacterium]|nr:phosphatidate cytidylyltransferase [Desulfuromonadaceae bacterium]
MTALIALPVVIFLTLFAEKSWFFIAVLLVAAVGQWEVLALLFGRQRSVFRALVLLGGLVICSAVVYAGTLAFPIVALCFMLCCLYLLFDYRDLSLVITEAGQVAFAWFYVPVLLSHLALLHQLPHGASWVFLVLLLTMGCDSTAYFVGTRYGRHRLYPAISPKKSIEGGLGGLAGAVLMAQLSCWTFIPQLTTLDALVIGALVGVLGQLGDLFESMLKRSCGVKDSGAIFPGHGGMLDRLDSLLFTFPVVYLYVSGWVRPL